MHDHNLDDLIIDNIEPKNSKTKSFLTIIALLIVILIIAIVLTRILLKTPQNNDLAFEQESADLIAPELKLQETPKQVEVTKGPVLSNMVESKPKPPVSEEKKLETVEEPALSNITEEIKAPAEQKVKEKKEAEEKAQREATEEKEKAEQKAREEAERKAKEDLQTAKPIAPKQKAEVTSGKKYYVQVGSFKNQPSSRIISVIKNNGFSYRILRSSKDSMNKLLIGPYENKTSANRALYQVKDRINKRAFVVKR